MSTAIRWPGGVSIPLLPILDDCIRVCDRLLAGRSPPAAGGGDSAEEDTEPGGTCFAEERARASFAGVPPASRAGAGVAPPRAGAAGGEGSDAADVQSGDTRVIDDGLLAAVREKKKRKQGAGVPRAPSSDGAHAGNGMCKLAEKFAVIRSPIQVYVSDKTLEVIGGRNRVFIEGKRTGRADAKILCTPPTGALSEAEVRREVDHVHEIAVKTLIERGGVYTDWESEGAAPRDSVAFADEGFTLKSTQAQGGKSGDWVAPKGEKDPLRLHPLRCKARQNCCALALFHCKNELSSEAKKWPRRGVAVEAGADTCAQSICAMCLLSKCMQNCYVNFDALNAELGPGVAYFTLCCSQNKERSTERGGAQANGSDGDAEPYLHPLLTTTNKDTFGAAMAKHRLSGAGLLRLTTSPDDRGLYCVNCLQSGSRACTSTGDTSHKNSYPSGKPSYYIEAVYTMLTGYLSMDWGELYRGSDLRVAIEEYAGPLAGWFADEDAFTGLEDFIGHTPQHRAVSRGVLSNFICKNPTLVPPGLLHAASRASATLRAASVEEGLAYAGTGTAPEDVVPAHRVLVDTRSIRASPMNVVSATNDFRGAPPPPNKRARATL